MTAYYNEIDPYAAQWLRNLIAAGHIAPGIVDERSIEDVRPVDLHGFTQCHFFAGIGVWSLALRRAGWTDDRPIWTASCPCQPFSQAGEGAGFADERHLWPHLHHLIEQCRPTSVLGEQVASKDADPWLDLVQTDLEAVGYAFGAVAFPSAGVGAPHIRDRIYWAGIRLDDTDDTGLAGHGLRTSHRGVDGVWAAPGPLGSSGAHRGLADDTRGGRREEHADARRGAVGDRAQGLAAGSVHGGSAGGLADTDRGRQAQGTAPRSGHGDQRVGPADFGALVRPTGPTNGLWRDSDWLFCRDGKWRPVEPGTFPLAHGAAARVGRLRAYGNAVNAEAARTWIETVMDCIPA